MKSKKDSFPANKLINWETSVKFTLSNASNAVAAMTDAQLTYSLMQLRDCKPGMGLRDECSDEDLRSLVLAELRYRLFFDAQAN